MPDHLPDPDAAADPAQLAARLRVVVGRLHRQLRRSQVEQLTPSQLAVLVTVEGRGPLRLGELAAIEDVTPPTLSRLVASVEERGLLRRSTESGDRRVAVVELTAKGRRSLQRMRTERTLWLSQRVAGLSPEQRTALASALDALEELVSNVE